HAGDEEAPRAALAVKALERPESVAESARRVHLDALAAAEPLEDGSPDEDRLQRTAVDEAPLRQLDAAQLGDRVVGVAHRDRDAEVLGEVAQHEDERQCIRLVAGDAYEGRR